MSLYMKLRTRTLNWRRKLIQPKKTEYQASKIFEPSEGSMVLHTILSNKLENHKHSRRTTDRNDVQLLHPPLLSILSQLHISKELHKGNTTHTQDNTTNHTSHGFQLWLGSLWTAALPVPFPFVSCQSIRNQFDAFFCEASKASPSRMKPAASGQFIFSIPASISNKMNYFS